VNKHISRHSPRSWFFTYTLSLLIYSYLLSLTLTHCYFTYTIAQTQTHHNNAIHLPLLSIQIIPPSHGLQQPNDLRRNGNGYGDAHQPRHGHGYGNAISSPYCRSCSHLKSRPSQCPSSHTRQCASLRWSWAGWVWNDRSSPSISSMSPFNHVHELINRLHHPTTLILTYPHPHLNLSQIIPIIITITQPTTINYNETLPDHPNIPTTLLTYILKYPTLHPVLIQGG
jgi:hypothetical protein